MFATFATDLFDTGQGALGALTVAPGDEIRLADYASFLAADGVRPLPAGGLDGAGRFAQFDRCVLDRMEDHYDSDETTDD